jgi:hypothetical protein
MTPARDGRQGTLTIARKPVRRKGRPWLSRFRSFVDEQTKDKDPNKVRIVIEW